MGAAIAIAGALHLFLIAGVVLNQDAEAAEPPPTLQLHFEEPKAPALSCDERIEPTDVDLGWDLMDLQYYEATPVPKAVPILPPQRPPRITCMWRLIRFGEPPLCGFAAGRLEVTHRQGPPCPDREGCGSLRDPNCMDLNTLKIVKDARLDLIR